MSEQSIESRSNWRMTLAALALVFSIFSAAWFGIAALGSKFGLWSWQFGLGTMTINWGPKLLMAAIGLSVIALVAGLTKSPRTKPVILGLAGVLIAGLGLGRMIGFGANAEALPPIHDIQTDWSDPVQFSEELLALRGADGASNPVEDAPVVIEGANARWPGTGGRLVSELQEEAEFDPTVSERDAAPYPYQIDTLVLEAPMDTVLSSIENVLESRSWDTVTTDRVSGVFEATETSGWFGFKDDVAIRVAETEEGVAVDIRSVSRVGLSDLGANAKRVAGLLGDIEREVTRRSS